ncbi:hypothetical protein [Rhizorhabdus histidinilytica]|nr:hypothetical protein [Rhizorhabdus histidinilytica]
MRARNKAAVGPGSGRPAGFLLAGRAAAVPLEVTPRRPPLR